MDGKLAGGALLALWAIAVPLRGQCAALSGRVKAADGAPIRGALVITSGLGFGGRAETGADGTFHLRDAGEFVSFRHVDYQPQLIRTADLPVPVEVQLEPSDAAVWRLPACRSMGTSAEQWIGGGLRIPRARSYEGPVYGDHDAHWYVSRGRDQLHIADGPMWHSGLPGRQILTSSERIAVRGWVHEDIAGLDIAGRSKDGMYWRWIGAPLASSVEYATRSRAVADEFDRLIATLCYGQP